MIISEDAKTFITDKLDKLMESTKQMSIAFVIGVDYCTPKKVDDAKERLDDLRDQLCSIGKILNRLEQIAYNVSAIEDMVVNNKEVGNDQT